MQAKVKENVMLDCVENFRCLGDVIGDRGGAEEACRKSKKRLDERDMSFQ